MPRADAHSEGGRGPRLRRWPGHPGQVRLAGRVEDPARVDPAGRAARCLDSEVQVALWAECLLHDAHEPATADPAQDARSHIGRLTQVDRGDGYAVEACGWPVGAT